VLTQLNIQGLAIIDSLSIEFASGFNVITGETGAGKSILIKALGFLLGSKASAETVRHGRQQATVTGIFEVPSAHPCAAVLTEHGIDYETADGHFAILVRRSVNNKGRSVAWINDVPVTVGVLRELSQSLIDVFGQHDNLRLLDAVEHTACLDQFLRDRSLPQTYVDQYRLVQRQLAHLLDTVDGFRSKQREADYLEFRCSELQAFAPSREDYLAIQELCLRADQTMVLAKSLEEAQLCLDQGAGGEALSSPLWEANKALARVSHISGDLAALTELTQALAQQIDDLSFHIGKATSGLELSEDDIESAQMRLAGYQELFRKLAVDSIDGLLGEHERLAAQLSFLESAASDITKILRELERSLARLVELAARLTKARQDAKSLVKKRIESELHDLAMPGARIDVVFEAVEKSIATADVSLFGEEAEVIWSRLAVTLSGLSDHGAEKAQLLLAANPGEPLLPLQKIASGGEISRIMLALKRALAAGADTCILVFDEIDTGISGRVAAVVGRKMQELSKAFQVICISHLAQVAAYADSHFLVHKLSREKRTESTISKLSSRASEEELARLLSGDEVTQSSIANARALVKKARELAH